MSYLGHPPRLQNSSHRKARPLMIYRLRVIQLPSGSWLLGWPLLEKQGLSSPCFYIGGLADSRHGLSIVGPPNRRSWSFLGFHLRCQPPEGFNYCCWPQGSSLSYWPPAQPQHGFNQCFPDNSLFVVVLHDINMARYILISVFGAVHPILTHSR